MGFLCCFITASTNAAPSELSIRHWAYENYTRVVFEVPRDVSPTIRYLPSDNKKRRPERLYFDLIDVKADNVKIEVGDGVVRQIRSARNRPRRTRVVLELDRYVRHRSLTLSNPSRVVIDVYGISGETKIEEETKKIKSVIVVDPGHGGRDPGALGLSDVKEKHVTLKVSKFLKLELEKRGFEVAMTRTTDRMVSLEERTAIAQAKGARAFLSIHANAAPSRNVRGIETYYLDRASHKQTLRVAARENGTIPAKLNALQTTIAGLRISENARVSLELAGNLHDAMTQGLHLEHGPVADLGVKKGPFQVLFLTDIPAVLVEIGFLTNPKDAKLLRNSAYLKSLSTHMARGVDRFLTKHESVRQRQ